MTWHRGDPKAASDAPERLNRLTCEGNDGYRKSDRPGARSYEMDPILCPEMIIHVMLATVARERARERGWQTGHPTAGDRCPRHRTTRPRPNYGPEGSPNRW